MSKYSWNASFPACSAFTCWFCPPTRPLYPPMAWCRLARFGRGEGDALGVQVVHQLGGTQADPSRLESSLELRQDQRLVLEDLSVQFRVGQDEGAHSLEAILEACGRLGGGYAAITVWVGVGGEAQNWVGPFGRAGWGWVHVICFWKLFWRNKFQDFTFLYLHSKGFQ